MTRCIGRHACEVTLEVSQALQRHLRGQKRVRATGNTLGEVVRDVDIRYPGFFAAVVVRDGLARFVNAYLGERDARADGGLAAPVTDGQTVSILVAVAGG